VAQFAFSIHAENLEPPIRIDADDRLANESIRLLSFGGSDGNKQRGGGPNSGPIAALKNPPKPESHSLYCSGTIPATKPEMQFVALPYGALAFQPLLKNQAASCQRGWDGEYPLEQPGRPTSLH
jgi:hypothetical protein